MENIPLLEGEDESEEDISLLKTAKEEFKNMQKTFQKCLKCKKKK